VSDESDGPTKQQYEQAYRILALAAAALLGTGTVVYRLLEDWSWVDSFYFSAVAVTTVGFGDLTPSTDGSKLFTVVYIFAGISIVATFLDLRMKRHAIGRHRRRSE
jgi:hypothetical protein